MALIALVSMVNTPASGDDLPRPPGGDDHAWMAYATFQALPVEERAWFQPEIAAFTHTYTHLPDLNWNNYGTFGGWSGLPDEPRTPDVRREWEICEFTGWNPNTGVGRRFGHAPPDAIASIAWHVPRIVERFRAGEFMAPIIQLGCLSHLLQDCATFPTYQALHRSAHFDVSKISAGAYQPAILADDVESLTVAARESAEELVAFVDARAPELRAALQASDGEAEQTIRVACCVEAVKMLADLYHTIIAIVGECPRPGPASLGGNVVRNPSMEEEDPGERLPRHWVVHYGDPMDRMGRAMWEGHIQRNARLWHDGRRAVKVMWTPEKGVEWRQTWPASVYVNPGELWTASAWTKVYKATGTTQAVLAFYKDDLAPVAEYTSASVDGTQDWQKLTVAAKAPEGAVRARLILRSCGNEGAAWFDDAELMRVDEATFAKVQTATPETDRLVLHLPFIADVADHSRFAGLNSPISAVCGADGGTLLQADETRGTVLALDGEDDFVEVPHSYVDDILSPEESMTISLWLNAQRPGPAFICGKVAEAGDEARGYKLELTEDGKVRFSVAVEGTLTPAAEQQAPLGQWAHIVATRTPEGTLTVSVDGLPGESVQRPGACSPSPRSFYVGADYGVKSFLQGRISDVRLFREAIAADDIEALD